MNVLSLFTGVGGLDLGLQRAGMSIAGQVEIDPFCRAVLARHCPKVPQHDDVRTAPAWWLGTARPRIDLVAGGFPCQPFSVAGRKLGTGDPRWGWPWFHDVVRAIRPRYVLVENVPALLSDGDAFGQVLSDLAEGGFDAEWSLFSACSMGAPHVRQRLFLVAYPNGFMGSQWLADPGQPDWRDRPEDAGRGRRPRPWLDPVHGVLAAHRRGRRMADGVPDRLELARVRALGNAVVPQVAENIGKMIMRAEAKWKQVQARTSGSTPSGTWPGPTNSTGNGWT